VAALLAVSIQDLRPSSQDTSAFYLQNIYQLLSDPNRSNLTILSTPSIPPAFSPPNYAVWVNSLWFLSLAISLTCGLQATLLQQWARRYIKITQTPDTPHMQARLRVFFAKGVETLHLPWAVEALPTLLHLSLFLFFAGLVVYLFNINHTVFTVVAWWVGLCTTTYLGVTLMPLFRYDSPYYAPLSSSAWYLVNGVLFLIFNALDSLVMYFVGLSSPSSFNLHYRSRQFRRRFYDGFMWAASHAALERASESDRLALKRVFTLSGEDAELEKLFAVIPSFFKSTIIDHKNIFKDGTVSGALLEFMHRTLSSHTLPDLVKQRRIAVCRKAMKIASFPVNYHPLGFAFDHWDAFLCSIDSALILTAATYDEPDALYNSKCAISIILARVQTRDHIWCKLATDHLGVSEKVLQDYLAYGDSASLANLNSLIRKTIDFYPIQHWLPCHTTKTFERVSKFDVQGTLPELRHDFCALWNELVLMSRAESPDFLGPNQILTGIRDIYIALHQSTASTLPTAFSAPAFNDDCNSLEPPSYPQCTVVDHHSGSVSHVHGDVAGTTDLPASPSSTTFDGGKILDFDTPTDVHALSPPTPSPYRANISPANKHSLDHVPAAPRRSVSSFLAPSVSAAQMSPVNDEGHRSPLNPFDSTATLVIRNGTYTDTMEHTANSHSRTSLLRTTSTLILPLHSNGTASPQQNEESTAVPLSTFSYPPSSSIPPFTNNAPPSSAFSSLPALAGSHLPTILVFLSP
jgi:hypothetical protein